MSDIDNDTNDTEQDEEKYLDPVAATILAELAVLEEGEMLSPEDMSKIVADLRRKPKDGPQLWRKYMQSVKQQAVYLARNGKIDIMRKGQVADPNDFKGLWKMRLHED